MRSLETTSASDLAARLGETGRVVIVGSASVVTEVAGLCAVPLWAVVADPAMPAFGPPAAVVLGHWHDQAWQIEAVAPLATLDAARFRLPLVEAVRSVLARGSTLTPLLVQAPAITRGMAAAELVPALVRASSADLVVLAATDASRATREALEGMPVSLARIEARSPSQSERARDRSRSWRSWQTGALQVELDLDSVAVVGAPPPRECLDAWAGRLAGLLDADGRALSFGEVLSLDSSRLVLAVGRTIPGQGEIRAVVIRDACHSADGSVRTAPRTHPQPSQPRLDPGAPFRLPAPRGGVHGSIVGTVVGGLTGDPMVALEHGPGGTVWLIDIGEHPELPARWVHRASEVLLSHAHMDHFAGMVWFLRRRVGVTAPVRIHGPAGTAARMAAAVGMFTWDRIGNLGPRFEIVEISGSGHEPRRFELRVGRDATPRPMAPTAADLEHRDGVRIRTVVLDHGGIEVLAYALEEPSMWSVRSDRLQVSGQPSGPWVGELKRRVAGGDIRGLLELPDGTRAAVEVLRDELLEWRTGQRLVYATDVADTPANRDALIELARDAHVLICEAAFLEQDRKRATATGHLTARACAEIASAAQVRWLVPFHMSSRYNNQVDKLLAECHAAFPRVWPVVL